MKKTTKPKSKAKLKNQKPKLKLIKSPQQQAKPFPHPFAKFIKNQEPPNLYNHYQYSMQSNFKIPRKRAS
jgi:hypothetical protein